MEMDCELTGAGRELVLEGDLGPMACRAPDRRAGEGAVVGPQPSPRAGQDLQLGLADRDLDVGAVEHPWDREPGTERDGAGPRRGRPRQERDRLPGAGPPGDD